MYNYTNEDLFNVDKPLPSNSVLNPVIINNNSRSMKRSSDVLNNIVINSSSDNNYNKALKLTPISLSTIKNRLSVNSNIDISHLATKQDLKETETKLLDAMKAFFKDLNQSKNKLVAEVKKNF